MAAASSLVLAGAAVVDITPLRGLLMCGYAARTGPATGAHDPLTARALVIGDTGLVVADVLGFEAASCARIRARSGFEDDRVVVIATHTHGAPMPGGCGGPADPDFLVRLEEGCVAALQQARANCRPARLLAGNGDNPGIAFNRRSAGGPIDPTVPVLRVETESGEVLALAFAHGCHPVVLGAGNRLHTGDFPHYARAAVETAHPGAVALFLPGCSGDVSTGHSPESSISTEVPPDRTFAEAERLGTRLAQSVLSAELTPLADAVAARTRTVDLPLERNEPADLDALAAEWSARAATATPAWAVLYRIWADWAQTIARRPLAPWPGRVTCFDWGGLPLVFLPGEIFAETALALRSVLPAEPVPFVVSLTDGVPGYIPPAGAYASGGYEVLEAHRYYGQPAAFAPGCAGALVEAAIALTPSRARG